MRTITTLIATTAFYRQALAAARLPAWNSTATKTAIVTSVESATKEGSADFFPRAKYIATFDNDGTLWTEQPMYFQSLFALDRVKTLAPRFSEWKTKVVWASGLKGDAKTASADGEKSLLEVFLAAHAGMTTDEFEQTVSYWIATAKNPTSGWRYAAFGNSNGD